MRRSWLRRSGKRKPEVRVTRDGRTLLSGKSYSLLRKQVYERDKGICGICHRFVPWEDYEMDHYRDINGNPILSRGGGKRCDTLECCRTSHRWCNRMRVYNERPVVQKSEF
jgi:hypothetical protein